MNQPADDLLLSQNPVMPSPKSPLGWEKCLSCEDYGTACNGPSLGTLGDIASVRAFHKAMRKARKIQTKAISAITPTISESTINEYFSNMVHDYKWTTVVAIDKSLISLCGNRLGLPPLDHACPASSSEVRSLLAAADLKLAAAELRAAQSETAVADLQAKIIELKGKNAARIDQMQADHDKYMVWMERQVIVWQRFAFVLLVMGIAMLLCLVL